MAKVFPLSNIPSARHRVEWKSSISLVNILILHFQESISLLLRINEYGLHEAANFTRQWIGMAGPHIKLPDIRVSPGINFLMVIQQFSNHFTIHLPPARWMSQISKSKISYRLWFDFDLLITESSTWVRWADMRRQDIIYYSPFHNLKALIQSQVTADWKVESELLSLWRIPLEGAISSQMTGLISEIAMQVFSKRFPIKLSIHQESLDYSWLWTRGASLRSSNSGS